MAINSPERSIVDNQDPEARCPGDYPFEDCPTAQELLTRNMEYRMDPARDTANGNLVHLLDDKMLCKVEACGRVCYIALEIVELKPSGNAKLYCDPSGA